MTAVVHVDGHLDRLACELCSCEIVALTRPNLIAYTHYEHPDAVVSCYRELDIGEPMPWYLDECGCRCHETARAFLRNRYDSE